MTHNPFPAESRRPRFAPILGALAAALWMLGLIFLCVPLWTAGIILFKCSNLCLWGGYRVRDMLETIGNKTEKATK